MALMRLGLLLWKNYILHKRKWFVTAVELFLPAIYTMILVLVRQRIEATPVTEPVVWSAFSPLKWPSHLTPPVPASHWTIAYYPSTNLSDTIMQHLKRAHNLEFKAFDSEEEMVNFCVKQSTVESKRTLGGVVFGFDESINNHRDIKFKIRLSATPKNAQSRVGILVKQMGWATQFMFPSMQLVGPRELNATDGGIPGYYREGFLTLQAAVAEAIISILGRNTVSLPSVNLRRMPYPPYLNDNFVIVIQVQLPLIIMLSFVIICSNLVKNVVLEKERRLKESLKIMGMSGWMHWLTWFITYVIVLGISTGFITLLLCVPFSANKRVLAYSNPSLIYIFFIVYGCSVISFSFLVTVFFKKANTAAASSGILFFATYLPYFFIQPRYETMTFVGKILSCLISNTGMALGGEIIGMFEGIGVGVQWSTVNSSASVDDQLTLLHVMIMMLLDAALYMLAAMYIETVFPGEFGVPQKWYFPLLRSYWIPKLAAADADGDSRDYSVSFGSAGYSNRTRLLTRDGAENTEPCSSPELPFEAGPTDAACGIRIRNMQKVFGSGKSEVEAVKNMNLDMYEGQITVLLGHNGAGKTTTMSILTGLYPPSRGTALISGWDIKFNINKIRKSLGFCPQHNVLFDQLTVAEHLKFFALLKGCPLKIVNTVVRNSISQIKLQDKSDVMSRHLSGGMKRRLSVGMALIAESRVVILDEPTSGLDPDSRRSIWDILETQKAGRTILLTTHFMDEADVLGDRIAIMASGDVKCCGSPLFLKKQYGAGYHLSLVKGDSCNSTTLSELIGSFVPEATLETDIGTELTYVLPKENAAQFPQLFSVIDERKEQLGISGYGISITTMEEVFMKVGGLIEPESQQLSADGMYINDGATSSETVTALLNPPKSSVFGKHLQQMKAMFLKKVLYTKRNMLVTVSQLLVPFLFTTVGLIVVKTMPQLEKAPSLALNLYKFDYVSIPYVTIGSITGLPQQIIDRYIHQKTANSDATFLYANTDASWRQHPDYISYLTNKAKNDLYLYNKEWMVGIVIDSNTTTRHTIGLFNNQAYHTPAMTLNMIYNAFVGLVSNGTTTISAYNHPLPRTLETKISDVSTYDATSFTVALNILTGMAFLGASFVLFHIRERASNALHLQKITGVGPLAMWLPAITWDLVLFCVPVVLLVITLLSFQIEAYAGGARVFLVAFLLVVYGWAIIPLMYLGSRLFTVPSTGLVWLTTYNMLTGLAPMITIVILSIPDLKLQDLAVSLEWVFLVLLPNFCLGQGFIDLYKNYSFLKTCNQPMIQFACKIPGFTSPCCIGKCGDFCADWNTNYLGWRKNGIGRMIFFLFMQGIVASCCVLFIESELYKIVRIRGANFMRRSFAKSFVNPDTSADDIRDEDVFLAQNIVESSDISILKNDNSIVLKNLVKEYGVLRAVNDLSVAVPIGECFGLLGANGAGKTTTFKILTGDIDITTGAAYVSGANVATQMAKARESMGYCPQFDALIEHMTGRELLWMFANLRGLPVSSIDNEVSSLIESLDFTSWADALCRTYSGGTCRKLSVAIALLGSPSVVLLDEPTTGMDPLAKRRLWRTLIDYRVAGRSLLLTSHSMEECEALCTKIGILINGSFKCLGTCQHLKWKFGQGFTLLIKVSYVDRHDCEARVDRICHFVSEHFAGAEVKDRHQAFLHFHVPMLADKSWASIFSTIESNREHLYVEDYAVSQASLEQVFLTLVRNQRCPDEKKISCWSSLCKCCRTR